MLTFTSSPSLFLMLMFVDWSRALKYGAPCQTMQHMTPIEYAHGPPNADPAAFEILILKPYTERRVKCYDIGKPYLVRIKPNNVAETFAGFLLQSRSSNVPDTRVGQFLQEGLDKIKWQYQPVCRRRLTTLNDNSSFNDDQKLTEITNLLASASITHVSSTPKSKVDTLWTIDEYVGPVYFKGTVVKSQYVWWNDIRSITIDYCKKSKPNEKIEISDTDDREKVSKAFHNTCSDIVPSCKSWSHFCETHAFIFRYCPMTCMKCVSFR
uniref:Reelin domain-containing protein n=1 Tax=Romanomermis culicivorax TaxID=13658 RepID=A0A915JVM3_ROMCU